MPSKADFLTDGPVPAGPSGSPPPGSGVGRAATAASNVPVVLLNSLRQAVEELYKITERIDKDLHIAAFNSRHNDHHMFFAGLAVKGPTIFPHVNEPLITADRNDWAIDPDWTWHRIEADAARSVTGIAAPQEPGTLIVLSNYKANPVTFQNLDAGSAAANQIVTGTGAGVIVADGQTIWLWYDGDDAVWRVV